MAEPLVQALSYSTLAVAAAIGGGLIGVLSIDMVIDGVLIGVSFLAEAATGILIAVALAIAIPFLGVAGVIALPEGPGRSRNSQCRPGSPPCWSSVSPSA
jgi:zinc transporter ZupT